MKHINEFGQISSQELRDLLSKIERLLEPVMQDCSAIEAIVIAKHVGSSAGFIASREAVRKSFEKKLDDSVTED